MADTGAPGHPRPACQTSPHGFPRGLAEPDPGGRRVRPTEGDDAQMRVLRSTGLSLAAVIVALPLLGGCSGPPSLAGSQRSYTYCNNGGIAETLNVYEPIPPPRSAPAVVDIHGGGWVSGDANLQPETLDWDVEPMLVGKGWVFVSINYRLAPSSPWPAQIEDAKCAVRFLRANAQALHIDPTRIGAIGASAGGHLAGMLGLTGAQTSFDEGGNLDRSSAVEAVVDEYGPTDLTSPVWSTSKALRVLSKETSAWRSASSRRPWWPPVRSRISIRARRRSLSSRGRRTASSPPVSRRNWSAS